ncbi:hypothetical protein [Methanobrevibacter gottschalkii]|uniref:hypothetical protein n=1 Tax=Methanobrevibacter gottschalkii TaxID=190974 RepID=UPI0026EF6E36|nr:hypothetical protein [Methanobrevibacter gottschalkii]MDD6775865.1 hypothetical protein [Methanobacteriaceae archaeon]
MVFSSCVNESVSAGADSIGSSFVILIVSDMFSAADTLPIAKNRTINPLMHI